MTNERVKTLPAKDLKHFLSTEILGQGYKPQQFPIFSAELRISKLTPRLLLRQLHQLCICLNDFRAANFDISSSRFCDAQVKRFHAGSTETIFRISTQTSLCQIPLQIVLEVLFILT